MKKNVFLLSFIFLIFFSFCYLTSCTTVKYRYRDTLYDSPQAALQEARGEHKRYVSLITPTDNPVGGQALCVIPSRDLIEKKGMLKWGNPRSEIIDYTASIFELSIDSQVEALQRRKIFDEVKIVRSDDPESVIMPGYHSTIYYVIKAPEQMQWFLRVSPNKNPFPIHTDTSVPIGAPRMMSWLNNIEKLLRENLEK